jgi:hypothetical protein
MLLSVLRLVELPAGLRKSRGLSANGIVRQRRTLSDAAAGSRLRPWGEAKRAGHANRPPKCGDDALFT